MGGGDLNLKKEWHPLTFKNQEMVWLAERRQEQEERKMEQLKKELEQERGTQSTTYVYYKLCRNSSI
jgi:N-terminal domain of CBF1 interacting co-repressor CIR